jgi:hypothetical protein
LRPAQRPTGALLWASLCACALLSACGRADAGKPAPPAKPAVDASKTELRNNAASLLDDLLGQEKNVSKILIIKHNSEALGKLIKAISKTSGEGADQLEELAKKDPSLNLKALQLPAGEKAARDAMSKTKEHELLFTSDEQFELNLLLTQSEATNYGAHLAKVAAENAASPGEAREFQGLETSLGNLYKQVVQRIGAMPRVPVKAEKKDKPDKDSKKEKEKDNGKK